MTEPRILWGNWRFIDKFAHAQKPRVYEMQIHVLL